MHVVCVGAGPGGLYAALLLKRARPQWRVTVCERNGPDETFGFGVVFSEPTLDRIKAGDPAMFESLLAHGRRWDPIELRLRGDTLRCHGQGFIGIGRHALLAMLRRAASEAGVELRFREDVLELPNADLIIASDGARSAIRERHAATFEPSIEIGSSRFIWFGTTRSFESLTFIFEKSEHGAFGVHAYPFAENGNTFIVETDEATLERAGLRSDDPREAVTKSLAYCEQLFAKHLDGHRLLANESRWSRFRTVRNANWRHGRTLLLGDSAHTAHFSMGSGTKMALEDALALAAAVSAHGDDQLDAALAEYEASRRVDVRKLQQAARPSLFWWEHFGYVLDRDIEELMFHFLTRNMRVTRESIARRDPALVEQVERSFLRKHGARENAAIIDAPLVVRNVRLPNRRSGPAETSVRTTIIAADVGDAVPDLTAASWVEVVGPPTNVTMGCLARVRSAWPGPLGFRIVPEGRTASEIVTGGVQASEAGADVLTLAWQGRENPDLIACADGLRFRTPLLLEVSAHDAGADPATLLLSGRAHLILEPRQDDATR